MYHQHGFLLSLTFESYLLPSQEEEGGGGGRGGGQQKGGKVIDEVRGRQKRQFRSAFQ